MRIGVKPGQWGWSFEELRVAWGATEDAGLDLLSCFDHVSAAPAGLTAWDAPTLLASMAGLTQRIPLAVHVLNISIRPPLLLAGQLAVAQAASGGRLEVGLGTGSWHLARHDHRVAGVAFPPFEERVRRLEACCRVFPALWRGATVSDDVLGLEDASLGPLGIEAPPVIVGGAGDRVLEVAAAHADAWNGSSIEPDRFGERVARLDQLAAGRQIAKQAQIWLKEVGLGAAREAAGRYEDAGADTLVFVLDEERDPDTIRRLADTVR
ncbi:MAG TPA: LLM class flavin-dependent oxidoreductase [Actinomycetota bacterium]|nr:LLM class flavin-dependent oxidoreductase [Actinomycetota bacterium]